MTHEGAGYEDVTPQSLTAQGVAPPSTDCLTRSLRYTDIDWEDFERLLARVAREVHGWRDVRIYGTPGQTQYGIDVVGMQPDGSRACIQSKKYQEFTESDFGAAVDSFNPDRLPVANIERFVVATAVHTNRRQIVDLLTTRQDGLSDAHASYTLEFWDGSNLDNDLRNQAGIVTEFFGAEAAVQFCGYRATLISPPRADHAAVAEAVRMGPNSDSQIARDLQCSQDLFEAGDFSGAVERYREAQERLEALGFPAHARMWDAALQRGVLASGDLVRAIELAARSFWVAVDSGEPADLALRSLAKIVSSVPECDELENDDAEASQSPTVQLATVIHKHCQFAAAISGQVIGHVSDVIDGEQLAHLLGSAPHDAVVLKNAARLLVLAAQTSRTIPGDEWAPQNMAVMKRVRDWSGALKSDEDAKSLTLQLDVEIADAEGDWNALLRRARRTLPRTDRASIRARAALAAALQGDYEVADERWMEAIDDACLDGHNSDAAEWVYARRNLKSAIHAWDPMVAENQRLAVALRDLGGGIRQPRIQQVASHTSDAIIDDQLRRAAIRGRTYLRLAYAAGSWRQVAHASELLAKIYERSRFPQQAVELLVAQGAGKSAAEVVRDAPDEFLDVTPLLHDPSPLVETAALKALSAQGDLVPGGETTLVANHAFGILQATATAETFTSKTSLERFLAALSALASLAYRLSEEQATEVVDILAPYVEREPNSGRRSDEAHVRLLNGIAVTHERLRPWAVRQLIALLRDDGSAAQSVLRHAKAALECSAVEVLAALRQIDSLNHSENTAIGLLTDQPTTDVSADELARARSHLSQDPNLNPGVANLGTSIVRDSVLAREDSAEDRRRMVAALLRRVEEEPEISAENGPDYLVAAFNLSGDLAPDPGLLERAIALARSEPVASTLGLHTDNPLAMFRSTGFELDPRPAAVAVAARLTTTDAERREVAALCRGMLPWSGPGADHLMRAFEILAGPHLIAELASRPEPELRSLAARLWIEHGATRPEVGSRLAQDVDPRVRNTLAEAMALIAGEGTIPVGADEALRILRGDPRFSVRHRLLNLPAAEEADNTPVSP